VALRHALAVLASLASVVAGCGGAKQPGLVVGAVEDAAKSGDAPAAMRQAADAGFTAIALSAVWHRGEQTPSPAELAGLRRAVDAAAAEKIRPVVAVYAFSGETPLSDDDRRNFAAFAASIPATLPAVHDVIVGNEPNINLFWRPQFAPDGSDAAAAAFELLLAESYDAVKAVDDRIQVIGAGLGPRGGDDASSARPTHSPTRFLLDLGAAYRASGRTEPIMDALSIHPYGEAPNVPPTLAHPRTGSIGIADYRKLVDLLGQAFGGTKQPGRELPIVYGEYGIETAIPPAKASLYTGHEPIAPVSEASQGRYYAKAIKLAACQRTVEMLLVFHVTDEPRLEGLQSGVRYADGSPKASLPAVRRAIADDSRCGR
jgi:hypothetical protein